MNDLMVDLETLGVTSDSSIVAIGAVFFDPLSGDLGKEFYRVVDIETLKPLNVSATTIKWWMKQPDEARNIFVEKQTKHSSPLLEVLKDFVDFVKSSSSTPLVWGNGARFDNNILWNNLLMHNLTPPWNYANDRDVRTVVDIGRRILNYNGKIDIPFEGVQHNALDDAKHQVKYVSEVYKKLQN